LYELARSDVARINYTALTQTEVNHLLVNNYRELQAVLDESLDECGDRVKAKLANISQAVAVDDLTAIAEGLRDVRRDLNLIAEQTQQLQLLSDQLQVGLEGVRQELGSLLQLCSSPACQLLAAEYDPSQLSVQAEFRQNATLSLGEHVRFNRTNVMEAVRELIEQAESVQEYLSTLGWVTRVRGARAPGQTCIRLCDCDRYDLTSPVHGE